MRIVIDMQGAQAENRARGIGRYAMSLALAVVHAKGEHEVFLSLSGMFPETLETIRAAFSKCLPQDNIRVWYAPGPLRECEPSNDARRKRAELVREAFLASLRPNIVLITSLFEGFVDDAVFSNDRSVNLPTAVILYDLIPYIYQDMYLDDPAMKSWYMNKIEYLKKTELCLAISESSLQEGLNCLGLSEEKAVSISSDAGEQFKRLEISSIEKRRLQEKYGLTKPFVMYTGGIDPRKNIEGLIRGFALLPKALMKQNQLAIVCSVKEEDNHRLRTLAKDLGLSPDSLILTGFVPECDLVGLYNLCMLFVFPSKHEGFGLPALEAMRCGAPVVAAKTSGLSEIVGMEEALFDPHSDRAIAEIIERAMTDQVFNSLLLENGATQSKKYSWHQTAFRVIAAFEDYLLRQQKESKNFDFLRKKKLAFVTPLPPERTGIADYSSQLLPELSNYYNIEVVVNQDKFSDDWADFNLPVRSVQWFAENASSYDRVVYQFGNSAFHSHMFNLLESFPGVLVLHDFYLSGVMNCLESCGLAPGCWTNVLFNSHGYIGLNNLSAAKNVEDVVWKYPCSLNVIQASIGVIVHSKNSIQLAEEWYGKNTMPWSVIPLVRGSIVSVGKYQARSKIAIDSDIFLVCSFGMLGPTKLNHRIVDAWSKSRFAQDKRCQLIFVGENNLGDYGSQIQSKITGIARGNISITGWVDAEMYSCYLSAADVAVQLRTLSRGETSAAVLDCMAYGLPTIINANGSMADYNDEHVWKLPDNFSDDLLVHALEKLYADHEYRSDLGLKAKSYILQYHSPKNCAAQYAQAIENFYKGPENTFHQLPAAMTSGELSKVNDLELMQLSESIALSVPPSIKQSQILVDISELIQRDARTGIQRVVRNILNELLLYPPKGYRVEPVYATNDQGYRYARRFTQAFLDIEQPYLLDEPIDYFPGDVFLGLDYQPQVQLQQRAFYHALRCQGVGVFFVVYDLLCISMPEYFSKDCDVNFSQWLGVVVENNGALCISKSVSAEFSTWVELNTYDRQRPFNISWFHLGGDVENSDRYKGLPDSVDKTLDHIRRRKSFLMVGTLEPRKAHAQVLDAFELLWRDDVDANLVIVGKKGWMVEDLVERLGTHSELNNRLFWLEGISDAYLEKVYDLSTCLIAASYGEGFGLPLIEAAQHNLPIIARDIPVFQEVAGDHAYYFRNEKSPNVLADSICDWLGLYQNAEHPASDKLPWLTWKESAQQLLRVILKK